MARILLGVSGGIAAYKACEVCRLLVRAGHEVVPMGWDPLPIANSYKTVRRVSLGVWPGELERYGPIRALICR